MKNKFGYDTACIKEDVCDMAICDGKSCNHYVSKAVVENCHSLQQLKAEIAALADHVDSCGRMDNGKVWAYCISDKLRQLSAV